MTSFIDTYIWVSINAFHILYFLSTGIIFGLGLHIIYLDLDNIYMSMHTFFSLCIFCFLKSYTHECCDQLGIIGGIGNDLMSNNFNQLNQLQKQIMSSILTKSMGNDLKYCRHLYCLFCFRYDREYDFPEDGLHTSAFDRYLARHRPAKSFCSGR